MTCHCPGAAVAKPVGGLSCWGRGRSGIACGACLCCCSRIFRAMQNPRGAIDTRTVIGQAQVVLMGRCRLSPSTAFAVLRRYSNQCTSKVVAVAEELITTASLPTADARASPDVGF